LIVYHTAGSIGWENRRLGTCGVPLEGVTVRIMDPQTLEELPADADGEITVAGPNVMVGYRKNPAANAESFYTKDDKRFFRTGDMGRMVEGKFLQITGRIKEQFKLENGKFVVPAPMEDTLCRSPFISQVCLLCW
jgi:long-chain acyl-CoA synthetase